MALKTDHITNRLQELDSYRYVHKKVNSIFGSPPYIKFGGVFISGDVIRRIWSYNKPSGTGVFVSAPMTYYYSPLR